MQREHLGSAIAVGVAALTTVGVFAWGLGVGSRVEASSGQAHAAMPHYAISIDTPDMLNNNGVGPAYVPSNMDWPANTTIEVSIYNFDDATPLNAAARQYSHAIGIIGSLSVAPLNPSDPNAPAASKQVMSLDPTTGVSHTFTVQGLGLSVPVAPHAITTFRFHTGLAGTYEWRCMDPCGSGASGWGGAMAVRGYMEGTITLR